MAIILMEEVLMGLDEVKASLDQAMIVLDVLVEDLSPRPWGRSCAPSWRTPCANHFGVVSRCWSNSRRGWMPCPRNLSEKSRLEPESDHVWATRGKEHPAAHLSAAHRNYLASLARGRHGSFCR